MDADPNIPIAAFTEYAADHHWVASHLTELFGVRLEQATVFAFLIWILTFVAVIPAGLVLSMREGLEWHKLRLLSLRNS